MNLLHLLMLLLVVLVVLFVAYAISRQRQTKITTDPIQLPPIGDDEPDEGPPSLGVPRPPSERLRRMSRR